jgi:aspartate carbamoyltransferase regulatory subunit
MASTTEQTELSSEEIGSIAVKTFRIAVMLFENENIPKKFKKQMAQELKKAFDK